MRVKDRKTGIVYTSENKQVIEAWLKNPDRFVQPRAATRASKGRKSTKKK